MKNRSKIGRVQSEIGVLMKNWELVKELRDGPVDRHELAEQLGVSSKTVYRRSRTLIDLELVGRDSDGYRLTSLGGLHAELFEYVRDVSATISDVSGLFEEVPPDAVPPFQVLENADIICSQPHAPAKPLETLESFVDDVTKVKDVSPVFYRDTMSYSITRS